MFTTGRKEAIINPSVQMAVVGGTDLLIEGVGRYPLTPDSLIRMVYTPPVNAVNGVYDANVTAVSGVTFAAGDLITVGITFKTTRRDPEFIQMFDYNNGKHLIFNVTSTGNSVNTLATDIRAALTAMSSDTKTDYHFGTISGSGSHVVIPMLDEFTYIGLIEINSASGTKLATAPIAATPAASQGKGLPKQLEENVRGGSFGNTGPYEARRDMQINWSTRYAQISFETQSTSDEMLNSSVVNGVSAKRNEFVIYVDEKHPIFTDAIVGWNIASTGTQALIETAYGAAFNAASLGSEGDDIQFANGLFEIS